MKTLIRLHGQDDFLSQISIRHAQDADLRETFAVLLETYRPYQWVMPPAAYSAYLSSLCDLEKASPPGVFVVAARSDRILGVAVYDPNAARRNPAWPRRWASLRAVAVVPEARRMGIGQMLLSACAGYARAQGASVLCLHVPEFTIPLDSLTERLGLGRAPQLDFDLGIGGDISAHPGLAARAYTLPLE